MKRKSMMAEWATRKAERQMTMIGIEALLKLISVSMLINQVRSLRVGEASNLQRASRGHTVWFWLIYRDEIPRSTMYSIA